MPFRPMSSRALATAFADLAEILAAERDVTAALRRLCRYCVDLLDVAAAGVLLVEKGQWTVAAASDERTHLLFRQSGYAGPCQECVRTGAPVLISDVACRAEAWPSFVGAARDQGFASAYALPMRLRTVTQGMLGLFSTRTDSLNNYRIQIAQALADAIMAGIMQQWALRHADTRAGQLQEALDSRVVIEQAKGVLSQCGDIAVDQAFVLLRRYARSHNQSLHQLAGRLLSDRTLADDVLHTPRP